MVFIFCTQIHPRLTYVLDEIFIYRLGLTYQLTNDRELYLAEKTALRFNYSAQDLPGVMVPCSEQLCGKEWNVPVFEDLEGIKVLYKQTGGLGFDVFAMTFWFLSRMEEYQVKKRDVHGRFEASSGLLYQNGLLELPVLDLALAYFYQFCNAKAASQIALSTKSGFGIYPTLDIDIAFKFLGKLKLKQVLGICKSLTQFDLKAIIERITVIITKRDPWDVYDYLIQKLKPLKNHVRIFVHSGKTGKYDKPVGLNNKPYLNKLKALAKEFAIGIHPSYTSGQIAAEILNEKTRLETALEIKIDRSRQHFLKLQLPQTYRELIAAGINHDYTMGFADQTGFRAGTAFSFRFYDLEREAATTLVVHPFCLMDVTLKNYLHLDA